MDDGIKDKIAVHCDVSRDSVIALPTVDTVYEVPLLLEEEGARRPRDPRPPAARLRRRHGRLAGDGRRYKGARRVASHRCGGQVRRPSGRLHISQGGALPRRPPPRPQYRRAVGLSGGYRGTGPGRPPRRGTRHRRPRRLRPPGRRGHDRHRRLRQGAGYPVPRPLSRSAGHGDRGRPPRPRPARSQLHRVRPRDRGPRNRPHARPGRRHPDGRHYEAWHIPLPRGGRKLGRASL